MVPDLFGGKPLTMNEIASGVNTRDWLKDHTPDVVDPIAAATIKYVRETLGIKRVGAAGYCFGAKVGIYLFIYFYHFIYRLLVSLLEVGDLVLSLFNDSFLCIHI